MQGIQGVGARGRRCTPYRATLCGVSQPVLNPPPPVAGIALLRTEWVDRFVSLLTRVLVQGALGEQWWAPAGAVVSGTGQNLVLTVSLCRGPSGAPCLARKSNCTPTEVAVLRR